MEYIHSGHIAETLGTAAWVSLELEGLGELEEGG